MWTSNSNNTLDYYLIIPDYQLKNVMTYLKKSLFNNVSYVVDASSIDTSGYNFSVYTNNNSNGLLTFYILYSYTFKVKIILIVKETNKNLNSIDSVYANCNWLEREFCEMYNTQRFNKIDSRKLLLNYYDSMAPLKRTMGSRGNYEAYYDFSDRQVQFTNCMDIDL
jgi:NADH:ubiquinone oxidoreductase subunit C